MAITTQPYDVESVFFLISFVVVCLWFARNPATLARRRTGNFTAEKGIRNCGMGPVFVSMFHSPRLPVTIACLLGRIISLTAIQSPANDSLFPPAESGRPYFVRIIFGPLLLCFRNLLAMGFVVLTTVFKHPFSVFKVVILVILDPFSVGFHEPRVS
jgi:hypothetical protein